MQRIQFYCLLLTAYCLLPTSSTAQGYINVIKVSGIVENYDYEKMEGVAVTLYKNGKKIKVILTDKKGKYDLGKINLSTEDARYVLRYYKAGYVALKHSFSTKVPAKMLGYPSNLKFVKKVPLFASAEGMDKSILKLFDKPLSHFSYEPSERTFLSDESYQITIAPIVETLYNISYEEDEKKVEQLLNKAKEQAETIQKQLDKQKKSEVKAEKEKEEEKETDANIRMNANDTNESAEITKKTESPAKESTPDPSQEGKDEEDDITSVLKKLAAKEKEQKENKGIKSEYDKAIIESVAEHAKQEKAAKLAYIKMKEEKMAESIIERMDQEKANKLPAMVFYSNKTKKMEQKRIMTQQIRAVHMKNLIAAAAEKERAHRNINLLELLSKERESDLQRSYDIIPEITKSTEDEYFSTTSITKIKFPAKEIIYKQVAYILGNKYYYKNNVQIDESIYKAELGKYIEH